MRKPLGTKDAIMMLTLRHPDWSTDDLLAEISALNLFLPTRFFVSQTKLTFKSNLKFLKQAGVIDADARPTGPLHPDLIRKPKHKPKPKLIKPSRRHFYAKETD